MTVPRLETWIHGNSTLDDVELVQPAQMRSAAVLRHHQVAGSTDAREIIGELDDRVCFDA